jgi:hypothetical protein
MSRRFVIRLWLGIGFLAIGILFLLKENLRKDYYDLTKSLKITLQNLSYELVPPRRALFGVENKKVELKVKFAPVFSNFTEEDWQTLWRIIYGIYPKNDLGRNERIPPRRTQLTIPEMQKELKLHFPYPFEYFNNEHWRLFWKTLKIRR